MRYLEYIDKRNLLVSAGRTLNMSQFLIFVNTDLLFFFKDKQKANNRSSLDIIFLNTRQS